MAIPAKKQKGEQKKCKALEKWFQELKYSGIISKTHPQNTSHYLFCLICEKSILLEHQEKVDLDRHCNSKKYLELLKAKTAQKSVKQNFVSVS